MTFQNIHINKDKGKDTIFIQKVVALSLLLLATVALNFFVFSNKQKNVHFFPSDTTVESSITLNNTATVSSFVKNNP